jgi:CRP/FNR family cyclic AMP-dependent transcriptional regulator
LPAALVIPTLQRTDLRTQAHSCAPPPGWSPTGRTLLDIKISQSDLADWLGVTRQRINAATQKLQQDDLIRLSYSRITIVDPQRMAELARL